MRQGAEGRARLEIVYSKMEHIVASEKASSDSRDIVTQLETHLQSSKIFKCNKVVNELHVTRSMGIAVALF
jgi:hypothetical protein